MKINFKKVVSSLIALSGVIACGSNAASQSQIESQSKLVTGLFKIAECSAVSKGELTKLVLNLQVVKGQHKSITGIYSVDGNESAVASITAKVALITKDNKGRFDVSLENGKFEFSSDSEGGSRVLNTETLLLGKTIRTGTALGGVENCVILNKPLLNSLVHND